MMARSLDANDIFAGAEPKFDGPVSKLDFMKMLNWYAQNRDYKDSQKWVTDFFKKKLKQPISTAALKTCQANFGFICRIVTNGTILQDKDIIWFDNHVKRLLEIKDVEVKIDAEKPKNVISIQDRVREKASDCIGELEGAFDDYMLSDFKENISPYGIMHTRAMKAMHVTHIIEWAKKVRAEYDEALHTKDEQLREGYSNFTKPDLKKMIAFGDLIISDAMRITGESVQSRKPRKRKVKSPDELVKKLKYCLKFDELKLESVKPKDIIGCSQLFVYNTKTRKLGCYIANDVSGLSVKGSSITEFSETKSIQKTLRKPDVTLPEVLKGGKVLLRNIIADIRAKESCLTGRINGDTILLRTVK